ncbi:MAG: hypothetical protein K6F63_02360 [Lachnospiraceae bacterium]|nr:hypothetical protein [Lachnospiraceae bacterium]
MANDFFSKLLGSFSSENAGDSVEKTVTDAIGSKVKSTSVGSKLMNALSDKFPGQEREFTTEEMNSQECNKEENYTEVKSGESRKEKQDGDKSQITCEYCGGTNPAGTQVCEYCGAKLG